MKKYSKITLENGPRVPHSTIRGLKLAIKHKKQPTGVFRCECPSGNIHIWKIENTSTHNGVGYSPRKKSPRVGKGIVYNYTAKLTKVIVKD